MLYLAIIFHMHQPYYKNLLTHEAEMPWVRLHGVKDYLDMVLLLEKYPRVQLTFNMVPSLLEQIEDYTQRTVKDKFLELSYRPAVQLTSEEKKFIIDNFFRINKERVIAMHPRYYELYFKKEAKKEFTAQDYLDLQVWFNLSWIDPCFREEFLELKRLVNKARFFTEEEKNIVLEKQVCILEDIIPAYKRCMESGRIEVMASAYYHPILPLLYNTKIAKEANIKITLPEEQFNYPEDVKAQIDEAIKFYRERFSRLPLGMWPSEEGVCDHMLPCVIQSGIKWIVADESILFRSLKLKKRDPALLYQPHRIRREEGDLHVVFRDRNLSDLIGFVYHRWDAHLAVNDFMMHLENIARVHKDRDVLVTIAMDGENAWEYYANDGHDFLEALYQRLSDSPFLKTVTVAEYLQTHPAQNQIRRLAAGSWIYSEFAKWIGSPKKNKTWEYLAKAREELRDISSKKEAPDLALARKQMFVCEGSDWFWWAGEDAYGFDGLFRKHLSNFYTMIGKEIPEYLKSPL